MKIIYAENMFRNGFSLLKVFEVFTWIGLFALIPFTALGYFAEGSIPGQPLYSLKRGIENVVLTVDSLNTNAKSLYQVALVNKRLQEINKLLATSQSISELDINDFSTTLQAAQTTINGISDSIEKKQAEEQLVQSIHTYKDHLQELKMLVENTPSQPNVSIVQNNTNENKQNLEAPSSSQLQPTTSEQTSLTNPTPTISVDNTALLTQDEKQQIIGNINEITQTLDQTEADITGIVPFQPSPTPSPSPAFFYKNKQKGDNLHINHSNDFKEQDNQR